MRTANVTTLLLCACGPIAAMPSDDTTSGTSTTSMPGGSSTGDITTSTSAPSDTGAAETTSSGGSTSSTSSEGGESQAFIENPDGGSQFECDIWIDDCPRGDKCMPWANDGGNSWNGVICSPIADDAKQVGEPCTVVGSGVSGIDDCVARAMCWDVDPETNEGTCVGFCSGSEANPSCDMPCDSCIIGNEGVLILCLPSCDPLVQDCDEGQACWPSPYQDAFSCAPAAQSKLNAGSPCEWVNSCPPGLACIDPERVPDCEGDTGCCASFCDTAVEDPCASNLPGTTCVPWFGPGESPPCISQTIGVCALPEGA